MNEVFILRVLLRGNHIWTRICQLEYIDNKYRMSQSNAHNLNLNNT